MGGIAASCGGVHEDKLIAYKSETCPDSFVLTPSYKTTDLMLSAACLISG